MRRKLYLLVLLILGMMLLPGCSEPLEGISESGALQEKMQEHSDKVGIAFIGYVEYGATEKELRDYVRESACAEKYPFLEDCTLIAGEGAELYAFVPANDGYSITVCRAEMTENGEYDDHHEEVLYEGKKGEVILLRCNRSEIYSDVLISVTDGTETLEFHPMLSMMDGHVAAEPGCYDFSVYEQ